MRRIRILVLALFLCSLILPIHTFALAQEESETEAEENSKTCFPLDVIFIIDQSGSMSGSEGEEPTDPDKQRKIAVDAMIDWFGENIIDSCAGITHQVGVISFGTTAREDVKMTPIQPDTFEEAIANAMEIKELTIADDMHYTNPMSAFTMAKQMFAESKISDGKARKQVIIFLTDGNINYDPTMRPNGGIAADSLELATYINENFTFDGTLLAREKCLTKVEETYRNSDEIPPEEIAECMEPEPSLEAYQNSTYIYMILMNYGVAWPPIIRENYKTVTDSHAGILMDFYSSGEGNNNAIPTTFQTILEKLTGIPNSVRDCGPVAINPYLQRVTFRFYKYSPDFKVKIRYTDQETGKTYEVVDGNSTGGFDMPKEGGYISYGNGANERYVFNHPKPGLYYVESDKCVNDGVKFFLTEAQINSGGYTLPFKNIPQYDLDPYYDKSDPFYLTYEMRDSSGEVYLNEADPFGVDVKVDVTSPDGSVMNYPMKWDKEIKQFKSTEPLKVQSVGTYKVNITGTIKVHDPESKAITENLSEAFNETKTLFSHQNLEFQVDEVKPFEIILDNPEEGKVLGQIHGSILDGWPLPVVPIQVKAHIALRGDVPLDKSIDQILTNPDQSIQAWIEFPDGSKTEKFYLHPDKNSADTFTGEIPDIDSEMPLKIFVELSGAYNEDYRPDFRIVNANFSRQDLLPFFKPGFYFVLIWIVIILLLLLTVYQIWNHFDPVDGQLIIYQNNVVAGTLYLWSGKRVTRFKKKKLAGFDLVGLNVRYKKYDRYENDDVENTNEQVRDIIVKGKIECSKSKIDFGLASNDGYNYCENHPEFEMKYDNPLPPSRTPYLRPGLYFLLPLIAVVLVFVFFLM